MAVSDRRIVALRRAVARRTRMEDELRAVLSKQRTEQADIQEACDNKKAQIDQERSVLKTSEARITEMMTGSSCFSIVEMQGTMRYMDVVMDRIRVLERELDALEQQYRSKTDEISHTAQAIARNRGRIEACDNRISMLMRKLDEKESDIADDEAEEAALARIRSRG
jgi:type III secretion system HrpB7-like protein